MQGRCIVVRMSVHRRRVACQGGEMGRCGLKRLRMAQRPELRLLSTKDNHPRRTVHGYCKIRRDGYAIGGGFGAHCWHGLLATPLVVGSMSSDVQR